MNSNPLAFDVAQNDNGDWYITLNGACYGPKSDLSWTSKISAEREAWELNTVWMLGYEAGANMSVGKLQEAPR